MDMIWLMMVNNDLVGGFNLPSEKWWSLSVGMMTFPTEWKNLKKFQTTNQWCLASNWGCKNHWKKALSGNCSTVFCCFIIAKICGILQEKKWVLICEPGHTKKPATKQMLDPSDFHWANGCAARFSRICVDKDRFASTTPFSCLQSQFFHDAEHGNNPFCPVLVLFGDPSFWNFMSSTFWEDWKMLVAWRFRALVWSFPLLPCLPC